MLTADRKHEEAEKRKREQQRELETQTALLQVLGLRAGTPLRNVRLECEITGHFTPDQVGFRGPKLVVQEVPLQGPKDGRTVQCVCYPKGGHYTGIIGKKGVPNRNCFIKGTRFKWAPYGSNISSWVKLEEVLLRGYWSVHSQCHFASCFPWLTNPVHITEAPHHLRLSALIETFGNGFRQQNILLVFRLFPLEFIR